MKSSTHRMTYYSKLINHTTAPGKKVYLYQPNASGLVKVHQKHGKKGNCPQGFNNLKPGDIIALHQKGKTPYVVTHIVEVLDNGVQFEPQSTPFNYVRECKVLAYLDPTKAPTNPIIGEEGTYEVLNGFSGVTMQDAYSPAYFYVGNGHVHQFIPVDYKTLIKLAKSHPHYTFVN